LHDRIFAALQSRLTVTGEISSNAAVSSTVRRLLVHGRVFVPLLSFQAHAPPPREYYLGTLENEVELKS